MSKHATLLILVTALLVVCSSSITNAEVSWHYPGFRYRVCFSSDNLDRALRDDLTSGKIYARMDVNTRGAIRPDGGDIRVCDATGKEVEFYADTESSYGVTRLYCKGGSYRKLYAYFGNPGATLSNLGHISAPSDAEIYGVKICPYIHKTKHADDPLTILKELEEQERRPLATYNLRSFRLNDNGSGGPIPAMWRDQDMVIVSEGYLFAPWDDEYRFGTNSHGALHVIIDDKVVAGTQYRHYKDDSFNMGESVHLSRGTHRVTVINIRNKTRWTMGYHIEVGWKTPGAIFDVELPYTALKRIAWLPPVLREEEGRGEVLDFEVIPRYNILYRNELDLAHIELSAYGSGATDDVSWEIAPQDGQLMDGVQTPFRRTTPATEVFLTHNMQWQATLTAGGRTFSALIPSDETKLKMPMFIEGVSRFQPVVFRGHQFGGVMLSVPNRTSFRPIVDVYAEVIDSRGKTRGRSLRRHMNAHDWLNLEMMIHPCYQELILLDHAAFATRMDKAVDISKGCIRLEARINGYPLKTQEICFLAPETPFPQNATVDENGVLSCAATKHIIMADETNGHLMRRFAPIISLASSVANSGHTLLVGNGPDRGTLAQALCVDSDTLHASSRVGRPSWAYSGMLEAFKLLESQEFKRVIIMLGTDDAFERVDTEHLKTTVHAIFDRAFSRGTREFTVVLPPVPPGYEMLFCPVRDALKEVSNDIRARIIDLGEVVKPSCFIEGEVEFKYPAKSKCDHLISAIRNLAGF